MLNDSSMGKQTQDMDQTPKVLPVRTTFDPVTSTSTDPVILSPLLRKNTLTLPPNQWLSILHNDILFNMKFQKLLSLAMGLVASYTAAGLDRPLSSEKSIHLASPTATSSANADDSPYMAANCLTCHWNFYDCIGVFQTTHCFHELADFELEL